MYYLPIDIDNSKCAYVYDKDTIRVLDSRPTLNSTINYTDFFVNSHYMSKSGSLTFGQFSTLPTCLSNENLTTEYYYRNDFNNIVVIWFFVAIFVFYIPFKLYKRLFRRFN